MIDSSTELARERNLEAANGTLLAAIGAVLALTGFGVGKFYRYLHDAGLPELLDPVRSTPSFGASFIVLGIGRTKDFIARHVAADKPFFVQELRPRCGSTAGKERESRSLSWGDAMRTPTNMKGE